ncbi:MAG: hypothetical protein JO152_15470 [Mycobacteriaceae bacterium]|nr:hypothetical protein [Mycobacteriaceae bacterium]
MTAPPSAPPQAPPQRTTSPSRQQPSRTPTAPDNSEPPPVPPPPVTPPPAVAPAVGPAPAAPPVPVLANSFDVATTGSADQGTQSLTMILLVLVIGTWFYGNRISAQSNGDKEALIPIAA